MLCCYAADYLCQKRRGTAVTISRLTVGRVTQPKKNSRFQLVNFSRKLYEHSVHSVRLEPTTLTLLGTRVTIYSIGDAEL